MASKYNITRMFEEECEEGRQEGIKETLKENILEFLEGLGDISMELREQIERQTDDDVLITWFTLAIGTKSINKFRKKINT